MLGQISYFLIKQSWKENQVFARREETYIGKGCVCFFFFFYNKIVVIMY